MLTKQKLEAYLSRCMKSAADFAEIFEQFEEYEMLETLLQEDDYRYSAVSPQRCVWDGSFETCPNAFLCNIR